jgi:iron complex outermembrane receptor protein
MSSDLNFTTINNEVTDLPVDLIQTGTASGAGLSGTRVQVIKNGYPIGTFKVNTFDTDEQASIKKMLKK